MATMQATRAGMVAQSQWMGADAALAAASWVVMSAHDAAFILCDVDPEVLDRYREPNLSGEFADDLTPDLLAEEVGVTRDELTRCSDDTAELVGAIADAWEKGRDLVWSDALEAVALRLLGQVAHAAGLERKVQLTADRLRFQSDRHGSGAAR